MDQNLQNHGAGRTTLGDGDADVEFTSTGTILLADLDFYFNALQLGVSVTQRPKGATGPSGCTTSYLDQSGADREWITTYGTTAWVAYHDAQNSTMIRVKKSTDDGRTWRPSGSPLVGQGDITGKSDRRRPHHGVCLLRVHRRRAADEVLQCRNGSACAANRELLDLFEVAEDPATGKAAVIYSDTTMATWTGPDGTVHQLPEIVLAYEK